MVVYLNNKEALAKMNLDIFTDLNHYKGLKEFIAKDLADLDVKLDGKELLFTYYEDDGKKKSAKDTIVVVVIKKDYLHEYEYSIKHLRPKSSYVAKAKIQSIFTEFDDFEEELETQDIRPKPFNMLHINFNEDTAITINGRETQSNKSLNELYYELVDMI